MRGVLGPWSHFYTMPWHVTDVIIFHLGLFFTLLPPNYPKNQNFKKEKKTPRDIYIYIYYSWVWDTAHDRCNCYFSFWTIFCPFTPITAQKMIFFKQKNTWIYHHFTQVYQKSWSYAILFLRSGLWPCCYFSFWAICCPFTPITAQKIKISTKRKKHLEISSFYTCVPKLMIRWCTVPEIWYAMNRRKK